MRKLIRILQKAEVIGETVKTLVQYPSPSQDVYLLWSLTESRTRCSRVSVPRNWKCRIPWEFHCGDSSFLRRKGKDAASPLVCPAKGIRWDKEHETQSTRQWADGSDGSAHSCESMKVITTFHLVPLSNQGITFWVCKQCTLLKVTLGSDQDSPNRWRNWLVQEGRKGITKKSQQTWHYRSRNLSPACSFSVYSLILPVFISHYLLVTSFFW